MICGLLCNMWSVVWYVHCCVVCGPLYVMWLFYDMWSVVIYVGCCMLCELLYGVWSVV